MRAILEWVVGSSASNLGQFLEGIFGTIVAILALFLSIRSLAASSRSGQEQIFYNLLSDFSSLCETMVITSKRAEGRTEVSHRGRAVFNRFYSSFKRHYSSEQEKSPQDSGKVLIEKAWDIFYSKKGSQFGFYYRNLYNIIKYYDESKLSSNNIHINILRSKLSKFEVVMLFYNCLSQRGSKKFKPLVEKYSLLEDVDKSLIINHDHFSYFNQKAFGTK